MRGDEEAEITHVAIRLRNGLLLLMPKPSRHHHIISAWHTTTSQSFPEDGEQGFFDNQGRFLNRKQALHVALTAGQVKKPEEIRAGRLFSEDLW